MFYLFEIKNSTESDVESFETKDEAVAEYHKRMANAMADEECNAELLMVVNEKGIVSVDEYFIREVATKTEETVAEVVE